MYFVFVWLQTTSHSCVFSWCSCSRDLYIRAGSLHHAHWCLYGWLFHLVCLLLTSYDTSKDCFQCKASDAVFLLPAVSGPWFCDLLCVKY